MGFLGVGWFFLLFGFSSLLCTFIFDLFLIIASTYLPLHRLISHAQNKQKNKLGGISNGVKSGSWKLAAMWDVRWMKRIDSWVIPKKDWSKTLLVALLPWAPPRFISAQRSALSSYSNQPTCTAADTGLCGVFAPHPRDSAKGFYFLFWGLAASDADLTTWTQMTTLPASMAHVVWDLISLPEAPKCKSWSPPWLPLVNPILHVNDFFWWFYWRMLMEKLEQSWWLWPCCM